MEPKDIRKKKGKKVNFTVCTIVAIFLVVEVGSHNPDKMPHGHYEENPVSLSASHLHGNFSRNASIDTAISRYL
ncbi:MAG TPA: hypothetical protein VMW78_00765 [Anaerolineae bacterium]|nr:hypothetical protein [Anaerolineae bacterium]